jgi:hypothetical protein
MKAGDVAFFNGHVLHRSKRNWSTNRARRSFVGHYCNARSFTQWGADDHGGATADPITGMTNGSHILARGDTHLPFAKPKFATPCAAIESDEVRRGHSAATARMIQAMGNGLLGCAIADANLKDDHDDLPANGY